MSNLRRSLSIATNVQAPAGAGGIGADHHHTFSIPKLYDKLLSSSTDAVAAAAVGEERACHGFWHNAALVIPSVLFVVYLGFQARRNVNKLRNGRSRVMIAYYVLLWFAALLNLAWSSLQAWQCTPGKDVAWNLLSLPTASGILCLEISIVAFLLQDNYVSGLETLSHTFIVSGLFIGVDVLIKVICIFGFGIPLFIDVGTAHKGKWGIWFTYKLLFSAIYGYILFVHYAKWRDKLPPKPAFYNYVMVLFVFNVIATFASGLAGIGTSFGLWLYNLTIICFHSLYLPFLYATFLADFFQEEDWLLDNAYYSEMRDAGFFDSDQD